MRYPGQSEAVSEILALREELKAMVAERDHFRESKHRLEARVVELESALRLMTPEPGFPKCDSRCSSNSYAYDEDNRCDCGMDEIRDNAVQARAALARKGEGK